MTTPTPICPVCGHALAALAEPSCDRCHGNAWSLDGRGPLTAARGAPLLDFVRGLREVLRSVFALLHGRAFVGLLRVPVAMNAIAFAALAAVACFVLLPLFESCFASSWGVVDGLRSLRGQYGSVVWLATTWLLLAPPLLDVIAGPAQEPLLDAAERTMLGTRRAAVQPHALLRLRDRATLAAAAVVMLPVALALALVPWIGLPIVGLLGAAMAAVVWFEPPMAQRGLRLRARLLLLWRNRWRALGVGAGLQLAAVVPFLNLLGLSSVAALATASAFLQFEKQGSSAPPQC